MRTSALFRKQYIIWMYCFPCRTLPLHSKLLFEMKSYRLWSCIIRFHRPLPSYVLISFVLDLYGWKKNPLTIGTFLCVINHEPQSICSKVARLPTIDYLEDIVGLIDSFNFHLAQNLNKQILGPLVNLWGRKAGIIQTCFISIDLESHPYQTMKNECPLKCLNKPRTVPKYILLARCRRSFHWTVTRKAEMQILAWEPSRNWLCNTSLP